MKKNKLFESEINEFVAGKSVVNCLRNRKARKVMAESVSEEMSLIDMFDERFKYRSDLRKMANDTTKEAYMIIRKEYGDNMWRQLYMDDCDERGLIDMLNMYAEDGLNPQQIVKKMLGSSEQEEETINYARLADDVCASYRGPLSKLDLKDSINYIIKMVAKKIGKSVDALTPQELTAIQKAAKHSVWYVSEQEEYQVEDMGEPWEIHYPTEKELKEIARLEKVTVDDIFETEICDHYMSALETGDYSGLDEQDERLLDEWCLKYRYLWPLTQNDGEFPEASFGECDVCGMSGNVVPVLCVQRKRTH